MAVFPGSQLTYEQSAGVIASFVESVDGKVLSFEGNERRAHDRYVVAIPTFVQPLNDNCQPEGEAFVTATRDISAGGIGLIHTGPVTAKLLGATLELLDGRSISVLIEVLRCRPLGSYFDVAGEFVCQSD